MVLHGGVEEGMTHATAVMATLPHAFRSAHVVETARMVLQAVPTDHQERPGVGDLRSMLALDPPSR
jgi:hypothetical protein